MIHRQSEKPYLYKLYYLKAHNKITFYDEQDTYVAKIIPPVTEY